MAESVDECDRIGSIQRCPGLRGVSRHRGRNSRYPLKRKKKGLIRAPSFLLRLTGVERNIPLIVDWFTIGRDDYDEDIRSADGHYSVVCGIDDTHIFLQDPEICAKRMMKREVFDRVWFDFEGDRIRPDELIIRQLIAIYK